MAGDVVMKDPKGRTNIGFEKHIFVCENERAKDHPRVCCSDSGKNLIRTLFKQELNKSGLTDKMRANKAGCLDFCEQGPVVVIYPEGIWYQIKDPKNDVKDIVKNHLINGKIVERCLIKL